MPYLSIPTAPQEAAALGMAPVVGCSPTAALKRLNSGASRRQPCWNSRGGKFSSHRPAGHRSPKNLQPAHEPHRLAAYRASSAGGRRCRRRGGRCAAPGTRPPRRSLRGGWAAPAPAPAARPATPAARSAAQRQRTPTGTCREPC